MLQFLRIVTNLNRTVWIETPLPTIGIHSSLRVLAVSFRRMRAIWHRYVSSRAVETRGCPERGLHPLDPVLWYFRIALCAAVLLKCNCCAIRRYVKPASDSSTICALLSVETVGPLPMSKIVFGVWQVCCFVHIYNGQLWSPHCHVISCLHAYNGQPTVHAIRIASKAPKIAIWGRLRKNKKILHPFLKW